MGPNRLAVGFRLLARNLALGYQLAQVDGKPRPLAEPRAFAAAQVDGLGIFVQEGPVLYLRPAAPQPLTSITCPGPTNSSVSRAELQLANLR